MSNLFKRAFVRGLNQELLRKGVTVFPSKEAAEQAADYVADNCGMPDPHFEGNKVNYKIATDLCNMLVEASKLLCKEAGDKYQPGLNKTAASASPEDAAIADAWSVMEKCAAETSLMQGGDHPNTPEAAAQHDAMAALDQVQRPTEYAVMGERGVGQWERKGEGVVGKEEPAPNAPGASAEGSNSLIETSAKAASLSDTIKKVASGSLTSVGPNTPASAAKDDELAALDQANRPAGYAAKGEKGVGKTDFHAPASAVVGAEKAHPGAPTKSAFEQLFEDSASRVVPYLPEKMEDDQKIAHVRAMMGLDEAERAAYLHDLYGALGSTKEACEAVMEHFVKSAAKCDEKCDSLPPALKEHMIAHKDEEMKEIKEEKNASNSALRSALANLKTV